MLLTVRLHSGLDLIPSSSPRRRAQMPWGRCHRGPAGVPGLCARLLAAGSLGHLVPAGRAPSVAQTPFLGCRPRQGGDGEERPSSAPAAVCPHVPSDVVLLGRVGPPHYKAGLQSQT